MKKLNKILAISLSILLAGTLVSCNKANTKETNGLTTVAETSLLKTESSKATKTSKSKKEQKTKETQTNDKSKSTTKQEETELNQKKTKNDQKVKSSSKKENSNKTIRQSTKAGAKTNDKVKSTTQDNTPKPLPTKSPTTTTKATAKPTTKKMVTTTTTTVATTRATQAPTTTATTLGLDPWEVDWSSGSLSADLNNMRYIPGDKIFYAKDFGFDPNKAGEAAVEYMNNQLFDEDLWDVIDVENCSYYSLNGVNGNTVAYAVHIAKK
ncbi:hypothetical protein [Varibaculum cambriense]|uniref:hypothetical protein n=1 Tax=Varibaculum cambriense TaxID=184870 RepID=UPI002554264B|nr:hypothetical protein [Varibaculum cambriense]MDK8275392.1 hypothetical protein [Varibaculum cambriense]